jgi:hypothetical protein
MHIDPNYQSEPPWTITILKQQNEGQARKIGLFWEWLSVGGWHKEKGNDS